ncbi:CAAX protease [Helicobacter sp. NHP21005]|nr:CAAX protease [Helicobacter sp. NHP21005]
MGHYNKTEVALNLFHTLRNRCYHWENNTKTRQTKERRLYPRITTKIFNIYIGIYPDRTERFLDDLMKAFSEDLLKYSNRL